MKLILFFLFFTIILYNCGANDCNLGISLEGCVPISTSNVDELSIHIINEQSGKEYLLYSSNKAGNYDIYSAEESNKKNVFKSPKSIDNLFASAINTSDEETNFYPINFKNNLAIFFTREINNKKEIYFAQKNGSVVKIDDLKGTVCGALVTADEDIILIYSSENSFDLKQARITDIDTNLLVTLKKDIGIKAHSGSFTPAQNIIQIGNHDFFVFSKNGLGSNSIYIMSLDLQSNKRGTPVQLDFTISDTEKITPFIRNDKTLLVSTNELGDYDLFSYNNISVEASSGFENMTSY